MGNKHTLSMKLGELISYNKRKILPKKFTKTVTPDPSVFAKNFLYWKMKLLKTKLY